METSELEVPSYGAHLYAMEIASKYVGWPNQDPVTQYELALELFTQTENGERGRLGNKGLIEALESLRVAVEFGKFTVLRQILHKKGVKLVGNHSIGRKIEYFNEHKGRKISEFDITYLIKINCSAEKFVGITPSHVSAYHEGSSASNDGWDRWRSYNNSRSEIRRKLAVESMNES